MRLISYFVRLKQKTEGVLTLPAPQYRILLHCPVTVREDLTRMSSQYNQLTLPDQRAVLPPVYVASCPRSYVSVSIVCRCSRWAFWHLHTVPIELPKSFMSDLESRSGGRWQQVRFLENDCLELLLMQAAQNNGLTDGMKREMLQEVTYM